MEVFVAESAFCAKKKLFLFVNSIISYTSFTNYQSSLNENINMGTLLYIIFICLKLCHLSNYRKGEKKTLYIYIRKKIIKEQKENV